MYHTFPNNTTNKDKTEFTCIVLTLTPLITNFYYLSDRQADKTSSDYIFTAHCYISKHNVEFVNISQEEFPRPGACNPIAVVITDKSDVRKSKISDL